VRELGYRAKYEARSVGIRRQTPPIRLFCFGGLKYALARALGK